MKHEKTTHSDPLISRLRDQAQAFAPELPAGLHGRIASAIASTPGPSPARSWSVRGWMTATLVAGAVALTVFLLRDRTPAHPVVQARPVPQWAAAPGIPLATNPITLARQWVEKPLQDEANTLMNQLTSARDTLTSSLPATPKQRRPNAL